MLAVNQYAYALNNPVKYIDPTGRDVGGNMGDDEASRPVIYYHAGLAEAENRRNRPTVYYHARTVVPANNSDLMMTTARSGVEGILSAALGSYVVKGLKDIRYTHGINWRTGMRTLVGSDPKYAIKALKFVSKYAALFPLVFIYGILAPM